MTEWRDIESAPRECPDCHGIGHYTLSRERELGMYIVFDEWVENCFTCNGRGVLPNPPERVKT
jgi:DnaJ-class molecular chaperone